VADRNLPGVWKVTDGKPTIYFQGSKKFRTPLNAVRCLALDSKGVLYAGDSSTREIYRFDEPDKPVPLTKGGIGIPMSMAFDKEGALFVSDLELQTVFRVLPEETKASVWTKSPAPRGLAIDSDNSLLVLCNLKQPLVRMIGEKREVLIEDAIFEFANQLVVDESGNAYVTDGYAKAVWKVPKSGKPEILFKGEPLKNPVGLGIQKDRLLIADPHQRQIYALPLLGEAKLQALVK
jgi:sugar lactone lactonase YvrE